MTPTVVHGESATLRHGDVTAFPLADSPTQRWQRWGLLVFACFNAASLGTFFVVFVGLVAFPPEPKNVLFLLAVGSFALAVLVKSQFVSWSRLALRTLRQRR